MGSALAAAPAQIALEARDVGRFLLEFPDIAEERIQHRAPVDVRFRFGALDPGGLQRLDGLVPHLLRLFRAEHGDRQFPLLFAEGVDGSVDAPVIELCALPRSLCSDLVDDLTMRSEEHTSELQSLMRISDAV